jgi:hypothetical protein
MRAVCQLPGESVAKSETFFPQGLAQAARVAAALPVIVEEDARGKPLAPVDNLFPLASWRIELGTMLSASNTDFS